MAAIIEFGLIEHEMNKSRTWAELFGIRKMREQNLTVFSDTHYSDSKITFDVLTDLFLALICCLSVLNLVLIKELLQDYFSRKPSQPDINVQNINTNSKLVSK